LLDVAAGARDFERAAGVLQEHDVIGKAAEAAEHHVFIAGKLFARAQRGLPLALQDREVVEHFRFDFFG
jgi:hypothetical protein